jgi:hypothetical protein
MACLETCFPKSLAEQGDYDRGVLSGVKDTCCTGMIDEDTPDQHPAVIKPWFAMGLALMHDLRLRHDRPLRRQHHATQGISAV